MKRISAVVVTGMFLLFIHATAYCQKSPEVLKTIVIEPYPLAITFNKTTNLIFPYAIKSVDRGSRDVLAQKAKGVENILLVKAGRENFPQTNLSVITADGKLYSFLLNYSGNPQLLNLLFQKGTLSNDIMGSTESANSEAEIKRMAEQVAKEKRTAHGRKVITYDMRLRLNGLYIKNDVLYFQMELRNHSNITYDVDRIGFFTKDEQKTKRTASQEIELSPLYTYGDTTAVKEQSKSILVIAVPKFTIPDKKYLLIQLMEKAGGRHLHLKIYNRTIVKAKRVTE